MSREGLRGWAGEVVGPLLEKRRARQKTLDELVGKTIQIGDEGEGPLNSPVVEPEAPVALQSSGQSPFLLLFVVAVLFGVVGGGVLLGLLGVVGLMYGWWSF